MPRPLAFLLLVAAAAATTAPVVAAQKESPITVVACGDTRFTDPVNARASNPRARKALVARIADEHPDAVLLSGDLPWHGGDPDDYREFRSETASWHSSHLRVLPTLGNHEFSMCQPATCLENWWNVFPELRGKRWYSADVGTEVRVLAVDTTSPLTAGSEQRVWVEHEIATLPANVRFAIVIVHHPPVADIQTRLYVDHNPRPNEQGLADVLAHAAHTSRARFIVVAGHIHNYERFLEDNVVYLVSGGGGAMPYQVDRTPRDLYQRRDFPNFHYLKFTIAGGRLKGEMYRLDEPDAPMPHFTLKDTFEVDAPPQS